MYNYFKHFTFARIKRKVFFLFFHIRKWGLIANINVNKILAPDEFNQ